MNVFLRRHFNLLIDLLLFFLIYLFLFQYFPLKYLLLDTIITGGDTGSHYKTVAYLKEVLLPQGKVIGWYPGNYGGYPLFIMYFPLLYILSVGMSFFMKLTVSFKIITIVGPFLLPLCSYLMVRLCRLRFPGPGLAAAGSLVFLFNTSNSMWGGNVYSTLAGEFSYAVSFSLTFLFLGVLFRLMNPSDSGQRFMNWKWLSLAIVLLALIGLTHGFTLIICVVSSLFFLLTPRRFLWKALVLLLIFGVGGALFSGWFIQLFLNTPYTTAFNIIWTFRSIWEVIPKIFIPFLVLFSLFTIYSFVPSKYPWQKCSPQEQKIIPFLWFIIILCVLFFYSAEILKLPDIRFIPFVQYLVVIWGIAFLGIFWSNVYIRRTLPLIGFCSCILWMSNFPTDAKHWTYWNYRGFENAPRWEAFNEINSILKGQIGEARVAYEHNGLTNSMGTIRAFESLPHFTGRGTLEGLYFQSSLLSPFVFYAQSLYSKEISCPFPDYPCTRFNLERAHRYLELLNANQLILVSNEVKSAVRKLPSLYSFQKDIPYGPYEIWKIRQGDFRYVKVLNKAPKYVEPDNFRHQFYNWFRSYDEDSQFLYTLPTAYRPFFGMDKLPIPYPEQEQIPSNECNVQGTIKNESVHFTTNCLGQPHLVKVSYNPGWQVEGAIGPYLISPAFILVFPIENEVILKYDNQVPRQIGLIFTGIGIFLFCIILLFAFIPKLQNSNILNQFNRWIQTTPLNRISYFVFLILFVISIAWIAMKIITPNFQASFKKYERDYTRGDLKAAQIGFEEVTEKWQNQPTIDKVYYFLGLSHFRDNQCKQASESFKKILPFADSEYLARSYFHIGRCAQMNNKLEEAKMNYQYIIETLKDPIWSRHAKTKLKEISR